MAKNGDNEGVTGYGRPPKEHRIQPKEVRNPWGCKGKPNTEMDFMDEPFEISIDGKLVKVTRERALDHGLFNAALKGNVSATKELERRKRARARDKGHNVADDALSVDEQSAVDRYVLRRSKELDAAPDELGQSQSLNVLSQSLSLGAKK